MQHLNLDANNTPGEFVYEEILEKIGYGKAQWILLLVSGLLTITSVSAQQSMGIVVLASHCEFQTTQSEKGVMLAACVTGIFLSTYVCGYVSDAIGRRTVLLYGIFICVMLQFILMFVTSVWLFNIINLICGISLGGVSGGLYPYLSEFNIPRHRAVTINYSTMFVSVTAIYVPATAWIILSSNWSINLLNDFVYRPWRLIMLCNLLPGLIGGLILIFYPESPKILLSLNKERNALAAVDWISKFNRSLSINNVLNHNDISLKSEIHCEENILTNHKGCNILVNIAQATRLLLQKPHGLNFILCNVSVICMFFSSNGMQFWFPEIVNRTSSTGSNSSTVCEILDSSFMYSIENSSITDTTICTNPISNKTYIDNMIVGVAFLIGFSIQGILLNPFGRKNVLMTALICSILSGISLHFVSNPTAVLVLFCLYILLPGLSISIMLGAIVDLVPTHLRGKSVSLCMSLGRLGIIAATNIIGIMLEPYCNTTFALFTFTLIISIATVYRLPLNNST